MATHCLTEQQATYEDHEQYLPQIMSVMPTAPPLVCLSVEMYIPESVHGLACIAAISLKHPWRAQGMLRKEPSNADKVFFRVRKCGLTFFVARCAKKMCTRALWVSSEAAWANAADSALRPA